MTKTRTMLAVSGLAMSVATLGAMGQDIVPAQMILQTGTTPSWSSGPVTTVNTPFTAEDGTVGFLGIAQNEDGISRRFIFFNDQAVFFDDQAPSPYSLSGGEGTMGVASGGRFVYSPSISISGGSGRDGIWTNEGYVISDGDPAPGVPGQFVSFGSRPTMFGDGYFAFVGGLSATSGGATNNRVVYKGRVGEPGLQLMYKTGDVIDGRTLRFATPGLSFNYDFSDNAEHWIHVAAVDGPINNAVISNGQIIAEQGEPIIGTDPLIGWENFTGVGINDLGKTLIFGDALEDITRDAFVAYDLVPTIFEGDTVDGITLTSPALPRAASVNNSGMVLHVWQIQNSGNRVLFYGDGADLRGTSVKVVRIGDHLDLDGDGIGDVQVRDVPATTTTTPGYDLGDDGAIYAQLVISDIGQTPTRNAIVRFCPGCTETPCVADFNQDGGVDGADVEAFFIAWEAGDGSADVNQDGGIDGSDVEFFFIQWEAGGC
ncbi:MAG: hypothetical protein KF859_07430 [Phycisphaeraceae bacterium]|nr:hypothetical protein [Phycisphaeraceae bacterium]